MATVRLTCPCGHAWDHPRTEDIPADLRQICPECAIVAQSTLEPLSPNDNGSPISKIATNAASVTTVAPPISQAKSNQTTEATVPVTRVVAGFEILEEINRGGMGVIYKARQLAMKRLVALKAITPAKLELPGARDRFMAEVHASARLNSQHIVQVFTTDLHGPFPYLVMEYVPGIDLLRLVRKNGPLPVSDAVYYIRQAAEGLQHAHEKGLVHRDIKPSNLMVSPAPIGDPVLKTGKLPLVKILDMGLARVVSPEDRDSELDLTQAGLFLGTPDYVSPEQAEDATQADIRSDIYSLGGALFFLLTGEVPFPGKTLVEKIRRALTSPPPSAASKRKDVHPALNAVIRKMMARNPEERYRTPAEVSSALHRAMRGDALTASDSSFEMEAAPVPSAVAHVKAHNGAVRSLAVAATPEGPVLISAGDDSRLRLWKLETLQEIKTFVCDLGAVEQLVVAPNGKRAATCAIRLTTSEMGVQLWDLSSGTEQRRLSGPADNIRCVAISPDGKSIAAGSDDSMVWLWSTDQNGPTTVCMKGHKGAVTGMVFVSADSMLTSGVDGTVRQWDLRTGKTKGTLPAGVGPLVALAYGGKRVAVAGNTLAVRMPNGKFAKLDGHDGAVLCCAISNDGRLVASGGSDKTVRLWISEEATALATFPGHTGAVRTVCFDPSGKAFFSGGDDGILQRWPVPQM
ncbi:MAG TPA: serine/threonine-protein kinase [Gemmata sp.]|jgi:serine/threonine protein kinase|nr:serine/threonine-protein kinase [Gemmata sp.]